MFGFRHTILKETGRSLYHLSVLLKLCLFGNLNRIRSSPVQLRRASRIDVRFSKPTSQKDRYSIPKRSFSFALSKPTTSSSLTTVTGVEKNPNASNSSIASGSSVTLRYSKSIPRSESHALSRSQKGQPGWEYTITFGVLIRYYSFGVDLIWPRNSYELNSPARTFALFSRFPQTNHQMKIALPARWV